MVVKMLKIKERLLKQNRGKKEINFKGTNIRLIADFSEESREPRSWKPRTTYKLPFSNKLEKTFFKGLGEVEIFH